MEISVGMRENNSTHGESQRSARARATYRWIEISELDGFFAEGAVSILAAEALI
jgi:hypothetical protein